MRLSHSCYAVLTGLLASVLAGSGAFALTCTPDALAPAVPRGMTIASAAPMPDKAFCAVAGTVVTTGFDAPDGSARFALRLPEAWNGKFVFVGVGGLAGGLFSDNLSANPVDVDWAMARHYAIAITDQGHAAGGLDATWSLAAPGQPDAARIADYYFRATHLVTLAAKSLIERAYAIPVRRAYFDGCSNGGRQGMVEATRFPADYDGIVAGAPFFDMASMMPVMAFQKQQLSSPAAHIPPALLPVIDAAVQAACDGADGTADGLVQNPAACSFDPASLICRPGQTAACLTPEQATSLRTYVTAVHDETGRLVYPGYSPTDLTGQFDLFMGGIAPPKDIGAPEPWGAGGFPPAPLEWGFSDHIVQSLVMRDAGYDVRRFGVGPGGIVKATDLALYLDRTRAGNGSSLDAIAPYLDAGRRLILYHGLSDHALSPFRTVRYMDDLAAARGGFDTLGATARFFPVPGMQHCGGGPGPNRFNTLAALDAWVEDGTPPAAIIATATAKDATRTTEARTMPLCPYPTMATATPGTDRDRAENWSCAPNRRMLDIGAIGLASGLRTAGRPVQ